MSTPATATSITRPQRAFRHVFLGTAIAHGALVVMQPFTAGMSLDFGRPALDWHGTTANLIVAVGFVQVIAAILALRPGRLSARTPILAIALFTAEICQLAAGYGAEFSILLPLGVGIVAGSLVLIVIAVREIRTRER